MFDDRHGLEWALKPSDLAQVGYVDKATGSRGALTFQFRGTRARWVRSVLGNCLGLAFLPQALTLEQAAAAALLLAASPQGVDFGLQREGPVWLLWRRVASEQLTCAADLRAELDTLLLVMRWLQRYLAQPAGLLDAHRVPFNVA